MPTPEYIAIKQKKAAGQPFKAKYKNTANYHLFPVLIGTSPEPGTGTQVERVLTWKLVGNQTGWRCFRVKDLKNIDASNVPVPAIPSVDPARQNCVINVDNS
jgi:hypothetical protein